MRSEGGDYRATTSTEHWRQGPCSCILQQPVSSTGTIRKNDYIFTRSKIQLTSKTGRCQAAGLEDGTVLELLHSDTRPDICSEPHNSISNDHHQAIGMVSPSCCGLM